MMISVVNRIISVLTIALILVGCENNGSFPEKLYFTKDGGTHIIGKLFFINPQNLGEVTNIEIKPSQESYLDSVKITYANWLILSGVFDKYGSSKATLLFSNLCVTALPNESGQERSFIIEGDAIIPFDDFEKFKIRVHQEK